MLFCGTSGWTRPDWTPMVFPAFPARGFHPLSFLAERLDLVEIDQSFASPIRPERAHLWLRKVEHNPRFRFTAILGRRFTFDRLLDSDSVRAYKEGLFPLLRAKKLGAVLMRFPWAFRFSKENRDFLIEVRRTFHEFPLAAELRHASWTFDEALGVLMDYRIGFCNLDQPEAHAATPPKAYITSPVGYVRLLGRGPGDWTDETQIANYLYTPHELGAWQARVERVAAHTGATYVVMANGVLGKSVVNALQLRAALTDPVAPPRRRAASETMPPRPRGGVVPIALGA